MGHLLPFSVLFLIVASISLTAAYFILRIHPKGLLNRLFMAMGACLAIWSLGFAVIIVAPDAQTCYFWKRLCAIGYSLIYAIMVHFTLLLSGHGNLLRRKWLYVLIYLPAAFFVFAFVLSPSLTTMLYRFARTPIGWVNQVPNTLLNYLFYGYFVGYTLLCVALLALWRRGKPGTGIARQADLLIGAYLAAFVLGAFTDVVNASLYLLPLPQLAPVFFLIPAMACFYCVYRYHFMKPASIHPDEHILTEDHHDKLYPVVSTGFILVGILVFALDSFWWRQGDPLWVRLPGLLLAALGTALMVVPQLHRKSQHVELLFVLVSVLIVPLQAIAMAPFGGVALWVFGLIVIICSLVFNSSLIMFSASASMALSLCYLWGTLPSVPVVVDAGSYVSRLLAVVVIGITACSVHLIYRQRLRENARQMRVQHFLGTVASLFATVDEENLSQRFATLLEELLRFFDARAALFCPLDGEHDALLPRLALRADGERQGSQAFDLCRTRWQAGGWPDAYAEATNDDLTPSLPWIHFPIRAKDQVIGVIQLESDETGQLWAMDRRLAMRIVARMVTDVLEKLQAERNTRFLAYYDSLTQLPNRQLFWDRTEQAIHMARRNGKQVAVLFLDLDSFKAVNDTLGHEGGDLLIQSVAEMLCLHLRKSDTVARFGGDEFLVLLSNIANRDDIPAIAGKLMGLFRQPFNVKGQEVFMTSSAGVAIYPNDGEDAQTLIKHADYAMYSAKEKGKNQFMLCSEPMKQAMRYKATLTNHLYTAIERRELALYYQPQVDLASGLVVGMEALLRWQHPDLGMVSPGDFIPIAEQTGLINPIGSWVLENACRQCQRWNQMGHTGLRVAVNLSVVQLRNPDLVAQIRSILQRTGLHPRLLELEITESATTKEAAYIIDVLNSLKSLGLMLSIDDFGTEYSSLNRLKILPIDRLKMDIQFVHGIDRSEKDRAITTIILNLAHSLNLKLVAEGLESETQLAFLRRHNCDEVQGYYFHRPMPAQQAEWLLQSQPSAFASDAAASDAAQTT